MVNHDVISMPDKWEYPWYAAWDLAFHTVPLAMVDPDFAKGQLDLMLSQAYLHPTGQIPAYEWNFGDVNPPVHAFATLLLHGLEADLADGPTSSGVDMDFLAESFHKLLLNFTWWVNRKDPAGRNVFEGGFLGLDNIGVFDRSARLADRRPPRAGRRHRVDGAVQPEHARAGHASWPSTTRPTRTSCSSSWSTSSGSPRPWTRSASTPTRCGTRRTASSTTSCACPTAAASGSRSARWSGCCRCAPPRPSRPSCWSGSPTCGRAWPSYLGRNRDLLAQHRRPERARRGRAGGCSSLVNEDKLRRILHRMLDEERFLGPHGIRSISRWHLDAPVRLRSSTGSEYRVEYEPAESTTGMFGGNSNWRGPIWFPINVLIIRALLQHYQYYGDDFTVECPTGSGVADDAVRGGAGARPPAGRRSSCGTRTAGARSTAAPPCSRRTRTGATTSCSTSTSTATTAPASAPPTRPAGPAWWPG